MSASEAFNLETCSREPIHEPGAIQPHGLLLVVDQTTDSIIQVAGDSATLLNFSGPILGIATQKVLGFSLAQLLQRADTSLRREPTYLGIVGPFGDDAGLAITAHLVDDAAIVEAEPSVRPASAAKTLAGIRAISERIVETANVIEASYLAAHEVRRTTGYDRVMIYKFLPDGTGTVIAEAKDSALTSFLNHRFPASDIPKQARELYQRNAIRTIPNVNYVPAPLAPMFYSTANRPLDMSQCVLRSVSLVHIRYLKNMGVGASMSVSLLPRGELWGLIACHHTQPRLVSYEAQEACRHVGQILSQQIRSREESDGYRIGRELGAARDRVMRALIAADDPGALLLGLCSDLQAIVPSHGMAVTRAGTVGTSGHTPTETQIRHLVAWLERRISDNEVFATDRLSEDYSEAKAFVSEASGLLAIVLPGESPVTLTWFRTEQVEEINWAGNPHEPVEPGSRMGGLNPRKSFATWRETVKGRSRPWEVVEIESVQEFGPRAAFVLQQKQVRELNRLLVDANGKLAALAATDGLTGLDNRRAFDERLHNEWERASRSRRSLSMIILDLDFFKQYNDHFGHVMGDECLKQVAEVLKGGRRATDLAARIGGEEFGLLLPETDAKGAMALAETIRSRIENLQLPHPKSHMGVVTASFGLAVAADGSGTAQRLMRAADKALYDAKESGRNRVVYAIGE